MRTLALPTLLASMSAPLAILNALGGIVAGIWLAILGEWSAILLGLGILFLGAFVVSLLLAPGIALAGAGAGAIDRGNRRFGWLLILLASPWTYLVIIAWEVVIFQFFGNRATPTNMIPMWLWSYAAATGVWSYLANKEGQSDPEQRMPAAAMAFGAQVAYVTFSGLHIVAGLPIYLSLVAMIATLISCQILSTLAFGRNTYAFE